MDEFALCIENKLFAFPAATVGHHRGIKGCALAIALGLGFVSSEIRVRLRFFGWLITPGGAELRSLLTKFYLSRAIAK